jgi:hypothetical protein
MNAEIVAARLRRFLLALAALLCLGTLGELVLIDHLEEPLQYVPFVLCGLGLIAIAAVFFKPQRKTIWALRVIMVLVALGGFLGVYEHLAGNQEFALEINQQASGSELLMDTLTGASPVLAPGVLVITAIVAQASTYFHPALKQ